MEEITERDSEITSWSILQSQFDAEMEIGINPLFDKTEAGLQLLSLLDSVEKEAKLRVELNNLDDSIYIYRRYGDKKFVAYQNYSQFIEDMDSLIRFSPNAIQFKKKCKNYFYDLIEEQKEMIVC